MSYFYEEDEIQKIREGNDIVDLISEYINLKRTGQNYKGLCPFHNEKTPSFVVSPDKQIYHCFGCGAGGDVISFVVNYKNMDFKEALEELASRANITIDKKSYRPKDIDDKNLKLYEINREAAIYFYKKLRNSKNAIEYIQKRGIDSNIVKRFGIGYASEEWEGLLDYLKSKNFEVEDIDRAGLLSTSRKGNKKFDRFRGRVIFPIWDAKSRVIGFGGRLIVNQDNMPKYLNSPETDIFIKGTNLYGLNKARESIREKRHVIIVEGYMDVITLSIFGINNAVATLGTALTPEQAKLLKRYSDSIYIAYDSDSAGQNAAIKASYVLKAEGISPRIIDFGDNMDPDDFLNKYGSTRFKEKLDAAVHFIDFIISFNKKKYDMNNMDQKIRFVQSISEMLDLVDSAVEKEVYVSRISEETGISKSAILNSLGQSKGRAEMERKVPGKINKDVMRDDSKVTSRNRVEDELISLIFSNPAYLKKASTDLKSEWFENYMNRKIFDYLIFLYEERGNVVAVDIGAWPEDLKSKAEKIDKLELNVDEADIEKAYIDFVKKIKQEKLLKERENTVALLSVLSDEEEEKYRELITRLLEIDREIKEL